MTVKTQITMHRRISIKYFIHERARIVICVIWHSKNTLFDKFL